MKEERKKQQHQQQQQKTPCHLNTQSFTHLSNTLYVCDEKPQQGDQRHTFIQTRFNKMLNTFCFEDLPENF